MLIGFSKLFIHFWWLLAFVMILAVILFKRFQATEEGARRIDGWRMSAPIVGKVVKLNLFGQFARDARNPAAKWRAGPDRLEDHGAGPAEPADQGGDRQDARRR